MPTPNNGESQKDFVARCIPIVVGEGATQEQALGKCYGMFRSAKKEELKKSKALIDNMILQAEEEEMIAKYEPELLEKAVSVDGFESPEAGDLPEEGKNMLAKVYAHCRKDGGDKEKCSKIAWSSVKNAGYKSENKVEIYKRLEKSLTALIRIFKEDRMETIPEKLPQPSKVRVEIAIPKEDGSVGEKVVEKYYENETYAKEISTLLRDAPVENIPVDGLIATQDNLEPSVLRKKESEDDSRPIYVIRFKGRHYIYDGHHRVAVAKLKGLQTIRAKVVVVDSKANPVMKALVFKTARDLKSFIINQLPKYEDKQEYADLSIIIPTSDDLEANEKINALFSRASSCSNKHSYGRFMGDKDIKANVIQLDNDGNIIKDNEDKKGLK